LASSDKLGRMNKNIFFPYILVALLLFGVVGNLVCSCLVDCENIIIDKNKKPVNELGFKILSATINGDKINLIIEGDKLCINNLKLYTKGFYEESYPAAIHVYLCADSVKNKGKKAKVWNQCFTLIPIRLENANSLIVNLIGFKEKLVYKY